MPKEKRIALVTGGARRVGRAIVVELARVGFEVLFTYHQSQAEATKVLAALQYKGWPGEAIAADLTDPDAVANVAEQVRRKHGRLDVLVNNAALYLPGSLAEYDPAQAQRMWALNVQAPLLLCQKLADLLRQSRGHVINMCDLLAEKPWPAYLAYCATKAALANATLSLARALAPEVTVNGIAPGVVDWPDHFPHEDREKYLKRVPLARAGTPQDVANLVRFLVQEGSYITGQIIRLDGGRSIS